MMVVVLNPIDVTPEVENNQATEPQVQLVPPHLQLEPVDPNQKIYTWSDHRLLLSVVNGNMHFNIHKITLNIPVGTAWEVHMDNVDSDTNTKGYIMEGSTFTITNAIELRFSNQRQILGVLALRKKPIFELRGQILSLLTYTPRKEIIWTSIEYREGQKAGDEPFFYETDKLELEVHAHPLGIYAGAILGALFSAILGLVMAFQMRPSSDQDGTMLEVWRRVLRSFFIRFVTGVVATAIAVFLFQTTSDFQFPIAIDVKDFYGGFLLGLFGHQVAVSIYERVYAVH